MIGDKYKLKSGDEVDVRLARHIYCYLSNRCKNVHDVKRRIVKRQRRKAKQELKQ